jgi:hypothetical protein
VSGWYSGACSDGFPFTLAQPAHPSAGAATCCCRSHYGATRDSGSDRATASFGSGFVDCGRMDGSAISYSFSPRLSSAGIGKVGGCTGPRSPEPGSAGASAPKSANSSSLSPERIHSGVASESAASSSSLGSWSATD